MSVALRVALLALLAPLAAAQEPDPGEALLRKLRVDAATEAEIQAAIDGFDYIQRQGSAHAIRQRRLAALLDEHGLRAVPYLIEALRSPSYWSARLSAQGLLEMSQGSWGPEVRLLAWHLDAPAALIDLFGRGPESELVALNVLLDRTLRALTNATSPLVVSPRAGVREARDEAREAAEAWRGLWLELRARWLDRVGGGA